MVADAVPGINILPVGAVRTKRNPPLPQPAFNLTPLDTQKRADHVSRYRPDSRCPGKACSPEKMEKHSLSPVIAVMGYRNFPLLSFQRPGKSLKNSLNHMMIINT